MVDPAETEIDQMIVLFSKPLRHQVAFDRKTKSQDDQLFGNEQLSTNLN